MNRFLISLTPLLVGVALVLAAPAEEDRYDDPAVQDLVFFGDVRPILIRLRIENDGKPFRQVWDAFVADVFKKLDGDGDGVLNRAESAKLPPPSLLFTGLANDTVRPPARMSLADFADFCRQRGGAPFQFVYQDGTANNSGTLFLDVDSQAMTPAGPEEVNRAVFQRLDADKDGRVSKQELAAAADRLRQMDVDDDEMITVNEVHGRAALSGDAATGAVFFLPQNQPIAPDNVLFTAVMSNESGAALAQQFLRRYGPKTGQQPMRRLSAKDLSLSVAAMKRLDADGDGWLDTEELARFNRRPADVTVIVRMNQRDAGKDIEVLPPKGGFPPDVRVLQSQNGVPTLELASVRVELYEIPAVVQGAFTAIQGGLQEQYLRQFKEADRDQNGYLDANEARQHGVFRFLFALMDADHDGMLFEKEVKAFVATLRDFEAGPRACIAATASQSGRGLFDIFDGNGDGRLSERELRQVPKLLADLDRDGDGQVSLSEVPRRFRLQFEHGVLRGGAQGGLVLAYSQVAGGGTIPEAKEGPLWFDKMDGNRDGDVSRKEFLGTPEQFRKLDADGDGLISRAEAAGK